MNILTIDGTEYPVNIIELRERSRIVSKYSVETEDDEIHREPSSVFFDYELVLGSIQDQTTAQALYNKIHELVESHTVTLPHNDGFQTFTAYVTDADRKLIKRTNSVNKWGGYTICFYAKAPQITAE